ncbi:hypothetical protein B0H13DRAFT_1918826, partial [Mycena leptocephala]
LVFESLIQKEMHQFNLPVNQLLKLLLNILQLVSNLFQCAPSIAERNHKEQEGKNLSEPPCIVAILITLVTTKGEFNVDNEEDINDDNEQTIGVVLGTGYMRYEERGRRRLRPGMRTREYIINDAMCNALDEKLAGTPTTVSVGSQLGRRGWPNLDGLLLDDCLQESKSSGVDDQDESKETTTVWSGDLTQPQQLFAQSPPAAAEQQVLLCVFASQSSWRPCGLHADIPPTRYIVRLFGWARKYGSLVNLDLHTAPGSQNDRLAHGRARTRGGEECKEEQEERGRERGVDGDVDGSRCARATLPARRDIARSLGCSPFSKSLSLAALLGAPVSDRILPAPLPEEHNEEGDEEAGKE